MIGATLGAGVRAQPALPDLPGPEPAEPLPTAPNVPGQEPVEGEAYVILVLTMLTAALLALAIAFVLMAAWRGMTGGSKGEAPHWLAAVSIAGAIGVMYAFSEPMFGLFRMLAGPLWLVIFVPFLLILIVALLGLMVGAVGRFVDSIMEDGWIGVVGWSAFIALVIALNRYFGWGIWWSLAGAFGLYSIAALAVFGIISALKSKK